MTLGRWKIAAIGAAVVAAAAAVVWLYQSRPLAVTVLKPALDLPVKIFGLGTAEARVQSKLGFKVAGTLTELHADHGNYVMRGQLLARADAAEQKARVAKARAQVLSAEAAVQVAEAAVSKAGVLATQRGKVSERRQSLLARQSVSQEAADDAQFNEDVAKADLLVARSEFQSAKAKLDDARAQLEWETVILGQHELRSPFDGIVVSRARELGSVLIAGETLFTIVDPDTIWMLAYVDEARAGEIELGQAAEIKLRSLPQQTFTGRVVRIGIESDRVNEERRVYVSCADCPEAFFLGEQAEVWITTGLVKRALMVPEIAIGQFDGSSGIIWTVENGRLHRRPVTLGRRTLDGRIEVVRGLGEGALVPATTSTDFREQRAVRIVEDSPR
jgi:HlyD family secretion protein